MKSAATDFVKEPTKTFGAKAVGARQQLDSIVRHAKSYCGSSVIGRCLTLLVSDFTLVFEELCTLPDARALTMISVTCSRNIFSTTQHSFAKDTLHNILLLSKFFVCGKSRKQQKHQQNHTPCKIIQFSCRVAEDAIGIPHVFVLNIAPQVPERKHRCGCVTLGAAAKKYELHPDLCICLFCHDVCFGFCVMSKIGSLFVRILLGLLHRAMWFWIYRSRPFFTARMFGMVIARIEA